MSSTATMSANVLQNSGNFTHAYHIADIHIRRTDDRKEEFAHVFGNLVSILSTQTAVQEGHAIFVLAGDIFDDKESLSQYLVDTFTSLIRDLAHLAPTVVIPGNHDFKQSRPDLPDRISGLLSAMTTFGTSPNPIHYLDKTGVYTIGNVRACTVSVYDSLASDTDCGNVLTLPKFPFPDAEDATGAIVIAIAHSSVKDDTSFHGITADDFGCTLDWFQNHRIVMLGDEHAPKKWRARSGGVVAQPGSLLTHTYGEATYGHTCIEWDLRNETTRFIEVPNKFARVTASRTTDGSIGLKMRGCKCSDVIDIRTATRDPRFPKTPRVRLQDGILEHELKEALLGRAEPHQVSVSRTAVAAAKVARARKMQIDNTGEHDADRIQSHAHTSAILDWIRRNHNDRDVVDRMSCILEDPLHGLRVKHHDVLGDKSCRAAARRQAVIQTHLQAYMASLERPTSASAVTVHRVQARYIGRYRSLTICLSALEPTVLVDGPNNAGKSTFIDVIHIALYGKTADARDEYRDASASCPFVSSNMPCGETASTTIEIALDNKTYTIERRFQRTKDGFKQASRSSGPPSARFPRVVSNAEDEAPVYLIGRVGEWVDARVGSLADICSGAVLSQSNSSSFFKLDSKGRKELLEKHTGLDAIKHLEDAICAHRQGVLEQLRDCEVQLDGVMRDPPQNEVLSNQVVTKKAELDEALRKRTEAREAVQESASRVRNFSSAANNHSPSTTVAIATSELDKARRDLEEVLQCDGDDGTDLATLQSYHAETLSKLAAAEAAAPHLAEEALTASQQALEDARTNAQSVPLVNGSEDDTHAELAAARAQVELARDPETGIPKPTLARAPTDDNEGGVSIPSRRELDAFRARPMPPKMDRGLHQSWKTRERAWLGQVRRADSMTPETAKQKLERAERTVELLAKEASFMEELADLIELKFDHKCACCTANMKSLNVQSRIQELKKVQAELDGYCSPDTRSMESCRERVQQARDVLRDVLEVDARRATMDAESERWLGAERNDEEATSLEMALARAWWRAFDKQEAEVVDANSKIEHLEKALTLHRLAKDAEDVLRQCEEKAAVARESLEQWTHQIRDLRSTEERVREQIDSAKRKREKREAASECVAFAEDALAYSQYRNSVVAEQEISDQVMHMHAQVSRLETAHKIYNQHHSRLKALEGLRASLSESVRAADALKEAFCCEKSGGYAWHVYRNVVLPLLSANMNEFLAAVGVYRIHISASGDLVTQSASEDRTSTGVNRIGGADKFILELAARSALQRLGSPGFNWTQIFVDEGFTQFDANRRSSIVDVLVQLMSVGRFQQIVLTSHLESVRAACESTLAITCDGPWSELTSG